MFIKKATGVSTAAAVAAVQSVANSYPGAKVMDESQYKASAAASITQLVGLVYALLLFAVVIALLGISNALELSIFERTHELGLMRAVGMTRRQLRSTIRWESVIIALQDTVLGLMIGGFFGWAIVHALSRNGFVVVRLPYSTLALGAVAAAVAAMAAARSPARRRRESRSWTP